MINQKRMTSELLSWVNTYLKKENKPRIKDASGLVDFFEKFFTEATQSTFTVGKKTSRHVTILLTSKNFEEYKKQIGGGQQFFNLTLINWIQAAQEYILSEYGSQHIICLSQEVNYPYTESGYLKIKKEVQSILKKYIKGVYQKV